MLERISRSAGGTAFAIVVMVIVAVLLNTAFPRLDGLSTFLVLIAFGVSALLAGDYVVTKRSWTPPPGMRTR